MKKECNHKNRLPLYGRDGDKGFYSTKQLSGEMIFVCKDCGAILKKLIKPLEHKWIDDE